MRSTEANRLRRKPWDASIFSGDGEKRDQMSYRRIGQRYTEDKRIEFQGGYTQRC